MSQKQDVFIFGAPGNVGSELTEQIIEDDFKSRRITGVASSKFFIYNPVGLHKAEIKDFSNKVSIGHSYETHADILRKIKAEQKNYTFFVDVTSSESIYNTHLQIVRDCFFGGIVTANKNPLVKDIKIFQELTANSNKYGFQCSVMAGAGALTEVKRADELNDPILSIEGCLSGTLAFIIYKIRKGHKFSEAFHEAYEAGYTESDPRLDLNGFDVARKLLILARQGKHKINLDDINVKPFLPKEAFTQEDISTFLSRTSDYDYYFSKLIDDAQKRGNTIQYIAKLFSETSQDYITKIIKEKKISDKIPNSVQTRLEVKLKEIPQNDLLGNLEGTLNGFKIITKKRYPKPLTITAPGAGLPVTAGNIRDDLNVLKKYQKN